MLRTGILGLAVSGAALGMGAVPAFASTATVQNHVLTFGTTGSAANVLQVSRRGSQIVLNDDGARLRAGAGCRQVSDHAVTCAAAGIAQLHALLGSGDDRAVFAHGLHLGPVTVLGGDGDDRILSMGPGLRARGMRGDDWMKTVSPNDDRLRGDRGDDVLRAGEGRDVVTGNAGDDYLSSGPGNDLVLGGKDDDELHGKAGDDLLKGGNGEDKVIDLHGLDRLFGGRDPDYLDTHDGVPGDFENAGRGPDYGCAASPFPGDVRVLCDKDAGPLDLPRLVD